MGIKTIADVVRADSRRIELACGRNPPFGNQVRVTMDSGLVACAGLINILANRIAATAIQIIAAAKGIPVFKLEFTEASAAFLSIDVNKRRPLMCFFY